MMLIPIVLLIVLIGTNKSTMQKFFNEDVLQKLSAGGNFMRSETRNFVLFAALILMTIALARPVMDLQEHESKQELIPIVVAIDVSKSMLADDIYPNRLELAKKKLKYIVQNAQNSAIGVVLFAKSSFIMSPITQDFTSLMYLIEHLDTGLNFDNGSDMMSMIETADQLTVDFSAKNIILLSDGGNKSDYSAEIIYAKEKKINIYAVALATKKGTAIPKKNGGYMTNSAGEIVVVGLNEQMSTLAMQSGGGYIDFSLGNSDIDAILNDIYSKSKKAQFESQKVKTFTELFYYPLALALLVLLIAFSSLPRKKILSALALLFVLSPSEQ
ncbi:MAG: VWA domain-containing protein, partial [Campylobacterota bacterium]|nr:VWA domain-containing protein [Campylobacterota bacterium]